MIEGISIGGVPASSPAPTDLSQPKPQVADDESGFSKLIGDMVADVNQQHAVADQHLGQLMTGQTDDIHSVVLNAARADLSFRLMVEIRNKLIDAYQDVMRMQV